MNGLMRILKTRLTIFNVYNKKSGTAERMPDVIEDIRNEKQELSVLKL
jgi:hypothetical protein